jgi:hypothetical protein
LDRTEEAADIVEELLVVELLIAAVLLEPGAATDRLGSATGRLVATLREELDQLAPGTLPGEVHRRVIEALNRGVERT